MNKYKVGEYIIHTYDIHTFFAEILKVELRYGYESEYRYILRSIHFTTKGIRNRTFDVQVKSMDFELNIRRATEAEVLLYG